MVRNIVILIVLCIFCYAGFLIYKGREEKAKLDGGDFTCQGCLEGEAKARYEKENQGNSSDGTSDHKAAPARVAAEEADSASPVPTPAAPPSLPVNPSTSSSTSSMQEPVATSAPVTVPIGGQSSDPYTNRLPIAVAAPYDASLPASDSVAPNPSNGMKFAGSGSYQWYRQGNLTWRVDTTTGRSCIIYATMEEWRKQIVMSHGCGRNA